MNAIQRRHAQQSAAVAALLLLTLWLAGAGGRTDSSGPGPLATPLLQDAATPEAGSAPSAPSPPRRLNSSLSMPYFSFAQSLNPRS